MNNKPNNIPGFSGGASLYTTSRHYYLCAPGATDSATQVLPQGGGSDYADCVKECNKGDDNCAYSDDICVRSYIDCINACGGN